MGASSSIYWSRLWSPLNKNCFSRNLFLYESCLNFFPSPHECDNVKQSIYVNNLFTFYRAQLLAYLSFNSKFKLSRIWVFTIFFSDEKMAWKDMLATVESWSSGTGTNIQYSQLAGFFKPNSGEKNRKNSILYIKCIVQFFFLRRMLWLLFLLKCKFPGSEFSSIIRLNRLGYSMVTNN